MKPADGCKLCLLAKMDCPHIGDAMYKPTSKVQMAQLPSWIHPQGSAFEASTAAFPSQKQHSRERAFSSQSPTQQFEPLEILGLHSPAPLNGHTKGPIWP